MTDDVQPHWKFASKKRSKMNRDRAELRNLKRDLLERSLGRCEARGFSPLCTGHGVTIHHVVRRSQGGRNTLDHTVLICHACHARVHYAPAEALTAGLLRPGWAR